MSTKTRFEKEAKGNSEMAYLFLYIGMIIAWINFMSLRKCRNKSK